MVIPLSLVRMKVPEISLYVKADFSEWTKSQQSAHSSLHNRHLLKYALRKNNFVMIGVNWTKSQHLMDIGILANTLITGHLII